MITSHIYALADDEYIQDHLQVREIRTVTYGATLANSVPWVFLTTNRGTFAVAAGDSLKFNLPQDMRIFAATLTNGGGAAGALCIITDD